MRIAVDQDEVLAQFVKKVIVRWNKLNGTSFDREQMRDFWHMERLFFPDDVAKQEDASKIIRSWIDEEDFFSDLEPVLNAEWGLSQLIGMGHDVMITTSIPSDAKHAWDGKRAWMRKRFPGFDMKSFTAISRKDWIDADLLIDDSEHNVVPFTNPVKRKYGVFFDAPWNRNLKNTYALRVHGWVDLVEMVKSIDRGSCIDLFSQISQWSSTSIEPKQMDLPFGG